MTSLDKSHEETLAPAEQAELLTFVQQVEQRDVVRAEALVRLAKKQGTTVSEGEALPLHR